MGERHGTRIQDTRFHSCRRLTGAEPDVFTWRFLSAFGFDGLDGAEVFTECVGVADPRYGRVLPLGADAAAQRGRNEITISNDSGAAATLTDIEFHLAAPK